MGEVIRLYWTADVDAAVLEHLLERLDEVFSCAVQPGALFELLPEEFHSGRRQYRATDILRRLRRLRSGSDVLLALTGVDLFATGLNFVFGAADCRGRCALVSVARLREHGPAQAGATETFRRRTLIEAVHEVGHLRGLGHCPLSGCVMHFSNTLDDTDRKTPGFCQRCREFLE